MSIVTSTPVNLVWPNTWIFFMAAILGLSLSLCLILTVCTCRLFCFSYTCEPIGDDEFESDTLSWLAQQESKEFEEFTSSNYHQCVHLNESCSSSTTTAPAALSLSGKGRRVIGLKSVVVEC